MGTIQILRNKAGKYYVRVKHQNGHILCHCQAVDDKETALDLVDTLTYFFCNIQVIPKNKLRSAKNGQTYFRFIFIVASKEGDKPIKRAFYSETYSSSQKAEQGLNAVVRICKEVVIEDLT